MKKKQCSGCRERKSIDDDFNNDKSTKDGKKSQCRDCIRKNRPSRANQPRHVIVPPERVVSERINNKCMDRWWV